MIFSSLLRWDKGYWFSRGPQPWRTRTSQSRKTASIALSAKITLSQALQLRISAYRLNAFFSMYNSQSWPHKSSIGYKLLIRFYAMTPGGHHELLIHARKRALATWRVFQVASGFRKGQGSCQRVIQSNGQFLIQRKNGFITKKRLFLPLRHKGTKKYVLPDKDRSFLSRYFDTCKKDKSLLRFLVT